MRALGMHLPVRSLPLETTTAILLRRTKLTETSLILTWLTRDFGRLKTVAKGARSRKSQFAGVVDLFFACEISYVRSSRSDLHALREVRLVETHSAIRFDYARLALNARTAADLFPRMRHAEIVRAWAGIEGVMPDGIPVIGPSSTEERAWHAFGFSAHGFQLGPIVGSIVADLVTRGTTALPVEPFSIRRFAAPAG